MAIGSLLSVTGWFVLHEKTGRGLIGCWVEIWVDRGDMAVRSSAPHRSAAARGRGGSVHKGTLGYLLGKCGGHILSGSALAMGSRRCGTAPEAPSRGADEQSARRDQQGRVEVRRQSATGNQAEVAATLPLLLVTIRNSLGVAPDLPIQQTR